MGFLEDAIGSISGGDSKSDAKPKEQGSEKKAPAPNHSWHWGGGNKEEEGGKGSFGSFFSSFNSDNDEDNNNEEVKEGADKNAIDDTNDEKKKKADAAETSKKQNQWNSLFSSLMSNSDKDDGDGGNDAMGSILDSWIDKKDKDDDVSQGKSITEYRSMFKLYEKEVKRVSDIYFGDIEIQNLSPASIFYFLELEEGKKTPSWKCRKHRFHQNLKDRSTIENIPYLTKCFYLNMFNHKSYINSKVDDVVELNTYFHYADLAYNDNKDEIKSDLAKPIHGGEPYDLIHSNLKSEPHNPAIFVAVKNGTVDKKNGCEILLSIRGTAGIEDVITDVLCESVEYRGGRAHKGILESGRNIAKQFEEVMDEFIKELDIQGTVKVLIVGHSLGGGAASLAGLELEDSEKFDIRVVGFGTPGCLSKELGENAKYITTVVSDSDAIPRTSGESVVNVVLDVMEHDWVGNAQLDADLMLKDFQSKNGWIMSESSRGTALERINELLESKVKPTIREKSKKRLDPILFPPGACIHLWRNGSGISGSIVPGTFFDEIDVSRTMLEDHLCAQGYGAMFLQLMRQHHKDPHFRLETLYEKSGEE